MNTFLGIDPDTHDMPVAEVDEAGKLVRIDMLMVSKKLTGRDALITMSDRINSFATLNRNSQYSHPKTQILTVEAQELYQFGESKTKNPKSIMFLATVAGSALACFTADIKYFPTPQEWKGSVPKQIHQARVLGHMGWTYEKIGTQDKGYCVPTSQGNGLGFSVLAPNLSKSDWKHAVDAIGLAQYGREQYQAEQARKARTDAANH